MVKKPVIGISANYSREDFLGVKTGLGVTGQEWQLLADDYIKVISAAGGVPIILPIIEDESHFEQIIDLCDGILFSGGSDIDPQQYGETPQYGPGPIEPKRDNYEMKLAEKLLKDSNIPILGICRGAQLLNVAAGGTLYQDVWKQKFEGSVHRFVDAPKYHPVHETKIKPGSRLNEIFAKESIGTNRYNHQAIKELGTGFEVTMTSHDQLIEGIELEGKRYVVAVQWHPEMMAEKYEVYLKLFSSFIEESKKQL